MVDVAGFVLNRRQASMNVYFNHTFQKKVVNIDMGEWYSSDEDIIIQTVLGSCISVCLYTDSMNVGGMNHFMLPGKFEERDIGMSKSGRYGMYAMELLINDLMKKGLNKSELKAKVFGGANMLNLTHEQLNIGKNNILFIKEYLHEENIRIISGDIGKNFARTVLFFPRTKKVLLRKNDKNTENATKQHELLYKNTLVEEKKTDSTDVILF